MTDIETNTKNLDLADNEIIAISSRYAESSKRLGTLCEQMNRDRNSMTVIHIYELIDLFNSCIKDLIIVVNWGKNKIIEHPSETLMTKIKELEQALRTHQKQYAELCDTRVMLIGDNSYSNYSNMNNFDFTCIIT